MTSTRTSAEREAILYDWHNGLRLSRQNEDIGFWRRKTAGAERVAIMGAGTGRIARPLADQAGTIFAVDTSYERLARIEKLENIRIIHDDFCKAKLPMRVDCIVFPYSALQLVDWGLDGERAVINALANLRDGGMIWIDLSDSFQDKASVSWFETARGYSEELGREVVEFCRGERHADHYLLAKTFCVSDDEQLTVHEKWFFHPHAVVTAFLEKIAHGRWSYTRGYGSPSCSHRRIYGISSRHSGH